MSVRTVECRTHSSLWSMLFEYCSEAIKFNESAFQSANNGKYCALRSHMRTRRATYRTHMARHRHTHTHVIRSVRMHSSRWSVTAVLMAMNVFSINAIHCHCRHRCRATYERFVLVHISILIANNRTIFSISLWPIIEMIIWWPHVRIWGKGGIETWSQQVTCRERRWRERKKIESNFVSGSFCAFEISTLFSGNVVW